MAMTRRFQIGEMAKMFHLSVSSIRHYEDLGLITPEYIDSDTGYRYYSPRQFEVFNAIRYLRALDMPLSEISDFLKNRDIDRIEEKLTQQKAAVIKKQAELERIRRKIDSRLDQLRDAKNSKLGTVELLNLPACRIYRLDESIQVHDYQDMELPTSKLAERQDEAVVFLGKVGISISAEHLEEGRFDEYDGIFLVLDDADNFVGETENLPETLCVRIRFRGSHPQSPEQYAQLISYIKEHNLVISGFSREITMIDYGITSDIEKFVTEISIPVHG